MADMKKLARVAGAFALASAGLTAAVTVTTAGPASAATSCAGTLVEAQPIKNVGGTTLGWLDVYWDGTYNCVITQSTANTSGVKKWMVAAIWSCPLADKGTWDCHQIAYQVDQGNYLYYAGPKMVNGVGKCVQALGEIDPPDDNHIYQVLTRVGHC
jgi:hypothetical protein